MTDKELAELTDSELSIATREHYDKSGNAFSKDEWSNHLEYGKRLHIAGLKTVILEE